MAFVVIIVAVILAAFVVPRLINNGVNAASRQLGAKTYATGRTEATTGLRLNIPAPPDQALDQLVESLNLPTKAAGLVPAPYLRERSDGKLVIIIGSSMSTVMSTTLTLRPAASPDTSSGEFRVHEWKEEGAIVAGAQELPQLRERIIQAVNALHGTADRFSTRTA